VLLKAALYDDLVIGYSAQRQRVILLPFVNMMLRGCEMSEQSDIGVYATMAEAEGAVRMLGSGGFPITQVSIVAQNLESEKEVHGYITAGDVAKSGASSGAWLGGLFGVLIGAAFIWVPGFGPLLVAGPLAAMLLGGVEGAVAGAAGGGLLGALVGWGVSKKHVIKYEEHLKGGKYLVIAHGSTDEVVHAHDILKATGATEVTQHLVPLPGA
jgi:hypothetical protein